MVPGMRFGWCVLLVLGLSACGEKKQEPSQAAACGDYDDFGLSICDTKTLGQIVADGSWNTQVSFNGYDPEADAFSLAPGASSLFGHAAQSREVGPDKLFLSASYPSAQTGRTIRFSIAGCSASSPTELTGKVHACVDGQLSLLGTF